MQPINNIKLLEYSLKNKEPYIEDCYIKKGDLLISKDPKTQTALMKANMELIESISAYGFAVKHGEKGVIRKAIEKIFECVKQKHINFSEFVSFWPVMDISYGVYSKMSDEDKKHVLIRIVDQYIQMRHQIYLQYGYTPTTLQVGKDAKAHKESGSQGLIKVAQILEARKYKMANKESIRDFVSAGEKKFIKADQKGKRLFRELLGHYNISFDWSKKREGKMPDFLVRNNKKIIIVEHKHMKEGGGGQDKQINEIISFVGYTEQNTNVSYIAFLDGLYFNVLAGNESKKNKLYTQLQYLRSLLKGNKGNYFVNTTGFIKYLDSLR